MNYPTHVYICPGSHPCNGNTYDFIQVLDEQELNDKLKEGFCLTLPEAMAKEVFAKEHIAMITPRAKSTKPRGKRIKPEEIQGENNAT